MEISRGDLCYIHDPLRPTGSGTGFRGLALVDDVSDDEAKVRPIDKPHTYVRIQLSAVHAVFAATFVAREFLS